MAEALIPMVGAGAISGLGSYFGGQAAAKASQRAADQADARYQQAVGYQKPFMQGGQNALNIYGNATGVNGSDAQAQYYQNFQHDPGFQSAVDYGQQQIDARNAARGMGNSGNTQAALQDWSQHSLSQEYQQRLDNLFRESTLGANAANSITGASTGASGVVSNALQAGGTATGNTYSGLGQTGSTLATNLGNKYYGPGASATATPPTASYNY